MWEHAVAAVTRAATQMAGAVMTRGAGAVAGAVAVVARAGQEQ